MRRILDDIRKHGFLKIFKSIARKTIFQHKKYILISRSLENPIPEEHSPYNPAIRRATLSDVEELYKLVKTNGYSRTKQEFSEWIKKGYAFFIAIVDGKIVGYRCGSYRIESISLPFQKVIQLEDDDVWGKDVFVHPLYRGSRISSVLASKTHNFIRDAGYRRILAFISPDNIAMRSATREMGYKELKEIIFYRVLFFKGMKIKTLK